MRYPSADRTPPCVSASVEREPFTRRASASCSLVPRSCSSQSWIHQHRLGYLRYCAFASLALIGWNFIPTGFAGAGFGYSWIFCSARAEGKAVHLHNQHLLHAVQDHYLPVLLGEDFLGSLPRKDAGGRSLEIGKISQRVRARARARVRLRARASE